MEDIWSKSSKMQILLRVCAVLMLVLAACLVRLDSQTKTIVYTYKKEANYKSLDVLKTLVYTETAVAAYNFIQLLRFTISAAYSNDGCKLTTYSIMDFPQKNMVWLWACFLLDQVAVYSVFGWNTAAMAACMLAVTGAAPLQWVKLCNRYTRFCFQIAGSLLCGLLAFFLLAAVSAISAFNLFRFYSPNNFLRLKKIHWTLYTRTSSSSTLTTN